MKRVWCAAIRLPLSRSAIFIMYGTLIWISHGSDRTERMRLAQPDLGYGVRKLYMELWTPLLTRKSKVFAARNLAPEMRWPSSGTENTGCYKGNTGYRRGNGELDRGIFCDLAIARKPGGPLIPHPENPVLNSGHETLLWPYKEGVAALVTVDGHEKSTIQYAPDGVNFEVKNIIEVPPEAGAVYCPDKYANTTNDQGVTWGLCHARKEFHEKPYIQENCLVRFKCDLHQDIHRHQFKTQNFRFTTDTLFSGKNRVKAADLRDNESPLPDGGDFLDEVFAHPEYD